MDQSHNFSEAQRLALVPRSPASEVVQAQPLSVPYSVESSDDSEQDGGILEYWRMLRRHKVAILVSALCGLILGYLAGIPMKPIYRAHTSIEILNMNQDFMNLKQSTPVASESYDDTSEVQTQAKLIQSESVLKRVFAKLSPNSGRAAGAPQVAATGWRRWLRRPGPSVESKRATLVSQAAASLTVRPIAKTRLIDITVNSTDPQLAADFANSLTQEFIQQNLDAHYQATTSTGDWLGHELNDTRTELIHSENALQAYVRESGLIFSQDDTSAATGKLEQYQEQLSTATGDRITKQSRLALAKNSPPDSLADILSDGRLGAIVTKLNDDRAQLADLNTVYQPEYVKIKRLQAEIDNLQTAFEQTRADILRRVQNDYDEAVQKEKLLAAAYNTQIGEVTGQGEKAIQYNILKRDVDSNRLLYDTMLQQLKQSSIASALRASNLRVVDSASVPGNPFFPNFRMNSAVGMLVGLFLSVGLVIVHERADRTVQQPGEVSLWANLPELGIIPSVGNALKKRLENRAMVAAAESEGDKVELITLQHKPSMVAEAFRSVLTSVLFQDEKGDPSRVLVFTSAQASEGKTTIVSNLAIAAAEIRRKVLVVDADMRRPRMHQVFGLANDDGLSDLLTEELTEASIASCTKASGVPYLDVITAGSITHSATNLIYSPNMIELLEIWRKKYDMIFIDTPPTLQITDARVLGRLADAVILVARANSTTRDALQAVSKRFSEDRIRVMGAILNDWNPKNSRNGYYGYSGSYYNSYRYGYESYPKNGKS
jgi:polysaccharide biosynthesis transport protein